MTNVEERLAQLEEKMAMYDIIFAGAISNYRRIKAEEERQYKRDHERQFVDGENSERNRQRMLADNEKAKTYAKRQS